MIIEFYNMILCNKVNQIPLKINCQPTGLVDRGADCYTKGTGFESRVRHACKIVRQFIGGNDYSPSGATIIKWP